MIKMLFCIVLIFTLFQYNLMAEDISKEVFIASAKEHKVLKIGLADCITRVLKNNSEIKVKRIEPGIRQNDVRIANADFEPTLDIDYSLRDNTKEAGSALSGANVSKARDIDINVSVLGKLITGTEYDIELIHERLKSNSSFQSLNPSYTVEPKITITQPLFKGFGIAVNRADIIIARNNKQASEESFKNTVMDIVSRTKIAYYNYFYYLENYTISRLSLSRAKDLLKINNARYKKGLVSSVDLLETEAAVLQREKALISAESDFKKAEDELKLIINLVDDPRNWNAGLELTDKPQFIEHTVDLRESLRNSFQYRPDYQQAKIDLKNRDVKIKEAKNDLFPTLDLVGSFGLNGLGEDFRDSIDKIESDYRDWKVGVEFRLPWGGGERAKYDKRKLEKAQALIGFKSLEQAIILEVRDRVRQVDIQCRQVKASRLSKERETENYAVQKDRYAAGEVSTHDILDYQDRLAVAELDYIKALIDYNIAVVSLEKAEGLTLARNDIVVEE